MFRLSESAPRPGPSFCDVNLRTAARAAASGVGLYALVVAATLVVSAGGRAEARGYGYPLHTNIVATVFWIGEPVGNGSTENNAVSAYDDRRQLHYGGVDPVSPARARSGFR